MMTSAHVSAPPRAASPSRRRSVIAFLLAAASSLAMALAAQSPASGPSIGTIEGDDLLVRGGTFVPESGKVSAAPFASGADVTVRSGQALIELAGGGEIGICGPAQFSVIQSGNSLTLALDYGCVHPKLPPSTNIVIYTPLIVATPIAIDDQQRDLVVGLAQSGTMCVTSSEGAVRIEQQLSAQNVLVPQGGSITLAGGALAPVDQAATTCSCDVQLSRTSAPAGPSAPANKPSVPDESANAAPPDLPPPAASSADDEPIYQVFMPALTFNAASPAMPPTPSPEMMVIVRHARVHPGALFTGVVEAAAPPEIGSSPQPAPSARPSQTSAPAPARPGVYRRIRNYFQSLFGSPS
jgi:hypothetical protein